MPTWHTGAAWRVVNSLNKLNEQLRAYAPRSVPPATDPNAWGSLADDAHSTSSDHYPKYLAALGATAVVTARDFPNAPALGLDGTVVTEHMRQQRDPRVGYIIFNRHITGPNHGWQWEVYTGSDPHREHFHVSSVHTGLADSAAAWSLPGQSAASTPLEDIMFVRSAASGGVFVGSGRALTGAEWNTVPADQKVISVTVATDAAARELFASTTAVQIDPDMLRDAVEAAVSGVVSTAVRAELLKTHLAVD